MSSSVMSSGQRPKKISFGAPGTSANIDTKRQKKRDTCKVTKKHNGWGRDVYKYTRSQLRWVLKEEARGTLNPGPRNLGVGDQRKYIEKQDQRLCLAKAMKELATAGACSCSSLIAHMQHCLASYVVRRFDAISTVPSPLALNYVSTYTCKPSNPT